MRSTILRYIAVFSVAARRGGFKAAAEELGLSPSAVSNQIKELEQQLGVTLFTRTARGVNLTREGIILETHVGQGLTSIEKGINELLDGSLQGKLIVNSAPSLAQLWLLPLLGNFNDLHPEIDLHVYTSEIAPDLLNGDVDIRITQGVGDYPRLDSKLLMREKVTPVCSPELLKEMPVRSPDDLISHTLIHETNIGPEETSLKWSNWLDDKGCRQNDGQKNLYLGNAVLALNAAADGQGFALGRSVLTSSMLKSGKLVSPFQQTQDAARNYYSVTTNSSAHRDRIKVFRDWLHSQDGTIPAPDAEALMQKP